MNQSFPQHFLGLAACRAATSTIGCVRRWNGVSPTAPISASACWCSLSAYSGVLKKRVAGSESQGEVRRRWNGNCLRLRPSTSGNNARSSAAHSISAAGQAGGLDRRNRNSTQPYHNKPTGRPAFAYRKRGRRFLRTAEAARHVAGGLHGFRRAGRDGCRINHARHRDHSGSPRHGALDALRPSIGRARRPLSPFCGRPIPTGRVQPGRPCLWPLLSGYSGDAPACWSTGLQRAIGFDLLLLFTRVAEARRRRTS